MESIMVSILVYILLYIPFGLITGLFTSNIAEKKGYSAGTWFCAGFFFHFIGLVASAGLPLKEQVIDIDTLDILKECPDCKEMIKIKALVCKYCGYKFTQEEVDKLIQEKELAKNYRKDFEPKKES